MGTDETERNGASRRAVIAGAAGLIAASGGADALHARVSGQAAADIPVRYKTIPINGVDIFVREAGPENAPVLLLLHGFPTSSRMFRNLMPKLADRFRVIAPDYPAFGHSAVPSRDAFTYTHANSSAIVEALLAKLGVTSFAMYLMDFGGPIGYRLLLKQPDRVWGVVIQNTPLFGEPENGPIWGPLFSYWKSGTGAAREKVRPSIEPDAIREQYVAGTRDPSLIDPDNWTIDSALIARPGVADIMLDLLYDIRSNRQTVGDTAAYFAAHQAKLMIATGVNDPLFPGAIMRPPANLPGIAFHPIDSGHFALEDRCAEIAALTRDFLLQKLAAPT